MSLSSSYGFHLSPTRNVYARNMQPESLRISTVAECQSVHVAARTVQFEVSRTGFTNANWMGHDNGLMSYNESELSGSSHDNGLNRLVRNDKPGMKSLARFVIPVAKMALRVG